MSEEMKKIDKLIKIKDCQEGQRISTEYDNLALKFRETCVVTMAHFGMLEDLYSSLLSKGADLSNADNFIEAYTKGEEIKDEEIKKLFRDFERASINYITSNRNRKETLSALNRVKNEREKFGKKLFKRYGLDKTKTYKIEFKDQTIFEVIPEEKTVEVKPEIIVEKKEEAKA